MSKHKDGPASDFQVDDPAAAFRKLEEATRKILAVPKAKIDSHSGSTKSKKSGHKR